ncbi:protein unc-13 homolog A-like [Anguilla rostrata]|uniref:protein unc-13 homolog A-like n=1 Tax=Anguilla rostrata TaxID=7938 RepID=UPI0030CB0F6E
MDLDIKRGELHGPPDEFNAYVTVKVRNLKTTTVPLRGNEPSWEQNYILEINDLEKSIFVEVWDKRLIWDVLLGSVCIPLSAVQHRTQEGPGQWWPLHSDVIMEGIEVCGVDSPAHHKIMLDIYDEMLTEIPEDKPQGPMQRSEGIPEVVSGEDGQHPQSTITSDNYENGTVGSLVCFAEEIPTEDQDSDYQVDPKNLLIAAGLGESLAPPGLTDTDITTRSEKETDLDCDHKGDREQHCSDLPPPHLIDSLVNSGACLTTACSQVIHDTGLSDACESSVLPGSDLNMETMTPSSSSDHSTWPSDSTVPCSQRDDSTCCSPASSGSSPTSRPLERSEEDADFISHEAPSQVKVENAVTLANSIPRRWTTVLHRPYWPTEGMSMPNRHEDSTRPCVPWHYVHHHYCSQSDLNEVEVT